MDQVQHVGEEHTEVGAAFMRTVGDRQGVGRLAGEHGFQRVEHGFPVREAEHVGHRLGRDLAFSLGDGLVQQRQTVAHRAVRGAGDQVERAGLDRDPLGGGDLGKMLGKFGHTHAAQVEALAARQHRDRHLAGFGGGEDELHMRRRFLQRLQQRVERRLGQHVDLIEDEDFGARLHRAKAHRLDDLAHLVDAVVGCGVHFHDIRVPVGEDAGAVGAHAAGLDGRAAIAFRPDAVQRAGDDARGGGLADSPHAGEHEGMRDAAGGEGVAQGAHHRFLADQVAEIRRTVFAGQHPVGRGRGGGNQGSARGHGRGGRRRIVAEQPRPRRGWRAVVLGRVILEQAGHAWRILAAAAATF